MSNQKTIPVTIPSGIVETNNNQTKEGEMTMKKNAQTTETKPQSIESIIEKCEQVEVTPEMKKQLEELNSRVPIMGMGWQHGFRGVFHWKLLQNLDEQGITGKARAKIETKAYEVENELAQKVWRKILQGKASPNVQMVMAERYAEQFLGLA
ncbi:MAG: hypothetical protein IKP00_07135 [Victivallales bacterium]|nr:hypothetical protein [Victivallales bacterium]